VVHEDNDWGIEVVADDGGSGVGSAPAASEPAAAPLPEGLKFELPSGGGVMAEELESQAVESTDAGVDDLMAQLQNLTSS